MLPPSAIIQKWGFSMTEHEKYQEHIRHTYDAFCKTVIRHAAIVKDKAAWLRGANDNFLITILLFGSFVPLVTVLFVGKGG